MKRAFLYVLAVLFIAGFCWLGRWQLQRADFKQQLLDHSHQVVTQRHAVPLATAVEQDSDTYAWTSGAGVFADQPVLRLDNQTRDEAVGVRVYRVFQPDGARHAVLVDLGWRAVPDRQHFPPEPVLLGHYQLQGLMAAPPSAGFALGAADQLQPDGSQLLTRVDTGLLAHRLNIHDGIARRVLRLDPALPIGYARDLDVLSNTLPPERHRGYAVQWFALAGLVAIVTLILTFRRRPNRNTHT